MSLFSALRVALGALLVNKSRSALTCLGIIIGIGAVIAMTSAGGGARRTLDDRLDSVGKNLILIRPGARSQSGTIADFAPITKTDLAAIEKHAGPWLLAVAPMQTTQRRATTGTRNWNTQIVGSTGDFQRVCNWAMRFGRFLNEDDVRRDAPVCVIGETVQRKLFPNDANPVGHTLHVERLKLRVIGVVEHKGKSPIGVDQDDQIFMPISTLQHKLVGRESVAMFLASARSSSLIERAKAEINTIMREQHRIKAGEPDDFDVSSVQEMAEIGRVVAATMQGLIAIIASISLLVGGIGIMNIMLTSVTERTREIGIRKAVGATQFDVLMQFLIEAVVLSLLGGILGIVFGFVGAFGLARLTGWPITISPFMVVLACTISAAVGVFFGFYPAWKASRLNPIDALRYE